MQIKTEVHTIPNRTTDGETDQTTVDDLQERIELAVNNGWTLLHVVGLGDGRVLFIASKP